MKRARNFYGRVTMLKSRINRKWNVANEQSVFVCSVRMYIYIYVCLCHASKLNTSNSSTSIWLSRLHRFSAESGQGRLVRSISSANKKCHLFGCAEDECENNKRNYIFFRIAVPLDFVTCVDARVYILSDQMWRGEKLWHQKNYNTKILCCCDDFILLFAPFFLFWFSIA